MSNIQWAWWVVYVYMCCIYVYYNNNYRRSRESVLEGELGVKEWLEWCQQGSMSEILKENHKNDLYNY